jgi:SAM-dependent methyltransferase
MTEDEAFFTLHYGLDREGPGDRASLNWALSLCDLAPDAKICDAACGPGADIAGLLAHVPDGRVEAFDAHPPFVQAARARFADRDDVLVRPGDLADPGGPYDAIWCAGAMYFLGVEQGLATFRKALAPGGCLIFSEPVYLTDPPGHDARAFWEGYKPLTRDGLLCAVGTAGFTPLGDRVLPDAAWTAYLDPIRARIAKLRPGADPVLAKVLDAAEAEADLWHKVRRDTGYLLVVARRA